MVHIDLGILTANGNEDMLALAVLSLLANITAWSERHQASGRHTEVWFDEAHYISKTELTVKGFIVGTKVWRKLHTWLIFATQDFSAISAKTPARFCRRPSSGSCCRWARTKPARSPSSAI